MGGIDRPAPDTALDPAEWEWLVPRVARATRRLLVDAEVDELVGYGMEGLVRACRRFDGGGDPAGYLARRVRWAMIDGHRSLHGRWWDGRPSRPRPAPLDSVKRHRGSSAAPPDEAALRLMLVEDVRAAVDQLPPDARRTALALMHPGGAAALARDQGVTEGALIHRKKRLRRLLAPLRGWVVDDDGGDAQ